MQDNSKIYIDIQSLLDIRQSCLIHLMGEEDAIAYCHKEDYYLRDVDNFPVDMDTYNRLISEASDVCLSSATISYMLVVVTSKLNQMEKSNAIKETKGESELIVNTYPFMFTEQNLTVFKNALFLKLKSPVTLTMVCEPLSTWTPGFIKLSGITTFYCYEGSEWLSKHAANLVGGALKDTRMMFPTLGRTKLQSSDVKNIHKAGFKDIFAYTEFLFSQHTRIQFLPTVFYSNLITATAVLETFNEGIMQINLKDLMPKEETNGDIINKG